MNLETGILENSDLRKLFYALLYKEPAAKKKLIIKYPWIADYEFSSLITEAKRFMSRERDEGLAVRTEYTINKEKDEGELIDLSCLIPEGKPEPMYYILIYSHSDCNCSKEHTGRHGSRYTVSLKFNEESGWIIQN